jgi:hypothetical protein
MSTENKLNWKKDLDKFNLLNAKILYMIYYFFNINHFNNEQKKKLKELVILENSDIINSFKKFEKNSNLNDLEKDLQNIYDNEISSNIKKDIQKSIIHKAFESTINVEKNKQNVEINDDDDDDDDEEEDEDKEIELLNSPMGRELMERKKKKQKKNEKKTFITKALGKMKHNDSESDDEGEY